MDNFSEEQLQGYIDIAARLIIDYVPQLLLAIAVLLIGLWVIRRVVRVMEALLTKREADVTLTSFLTSLASVGLKILLIVSVASMVGIATTSFVAILGAAGLAIGLALQGSLSNFAGGVLILLFRPYRVGDFIEGAGVTGTVRDIQIFNTLLTTPDNKRVVVPNALLSNGVITNYSILDRRRIEWVFGIDYADNIGEAKAIIEKIISSDERVHADPAVMVGVQGLGDNSVNLFGRGWVSTPDVFTVTGDITEAVKIAFDEAGISFPFPQRQIHTSS